ncbi:hypothetical protein ACLOJK_028281, partial [Asimina triloba]
MMQRPPKSIRYAPDLAIVPLFCRSLQPDLSIGRRGFTAVELASMDAVQGEEDAVHHAADQRQRRGLPLPDLGKKPSSTLLIESEEDDCRCYILVRRSRICNYTVVADLLNDSDHRIRALPMV